MSLVVLAGCSGAPSLPLLSKPAAKHLTALPASKDLKGSIYFAQDGRIWRLRGGGLAQVSPANARYGYPAVTADGTATAAALQSPGQSVIAFGGPDFANLQPSKPLARDPHLTGSIDLKPAFSPNGKRIAIMSDRAKGYSDEAIWEGALSGGLHQVSFPPDSSGGDDAPQYLANGGAIIFVAWRGNHAGLDSAAVPFGRGKVMLPAAIDHDILDPAPGPGDQLAFTQRQGEAENIFVGPGNAAGAKPVTTFNDCRQPTWSPDGKDVLFISPHGGTFDLWIVPAAGGAAQQLTTGADVEANSRAAWIAT